MSVDVAASVMALLGGSQVSGRIAFAAVSRRISARKLALAVMVLQRWDWLV